jgi:hypothetical protein
MYYSSSACMLFGEFLLPIYLLFLEHFPEDHHNVGKSSQHTTPQAGPPAPPHLKHTTPQAGPPALPHHADATQTKIAPQNDISSPPTVEATHDTCIFQTVAHHYRQSGLCS